MFWKFNILTSSKIDSLLEKEDITLKVSFSLCSALCVYPSVVVVCLFPPVLFFLNPILT